MKHIKYLLIALAAVAVGSCSKDTTDSGSEARDAFLSKTEIGISQRDASLFAFDKAKHQAIITPSSRVIRLQTDAGDQYLEVTMASIPQLGSEGVSCTLKGNVGLPEMNIPNFKLLRAQNETIWLWSEQDQIGMILPWID